MLFCINIKMYNRGKGLVWVYWSVMQVWLCHYVIKGNICLQYRSTKYWKTLSNKIIKPSFDFFIKIVFIYVVWYNKGVWLCTITFILKQACKVLPLKLFDNSYNFNVNLMCDLLINPSYHLVAGLRRRESIPLKYM